MPDAAPLSPAALALLARRAAAAPRDKPARRQEAPLSFPQLTQWFFAQLHADSTVFNVARILTLRGRLAWAHDYDTDRSIGATFQSLPGASFVVNGAAQASDSALVTASVEKKWLTGWSAAATFEGEFSQVTASYAGKGVVRYQW